VAHSWVEIRVRGLHLFRVTFNENIYDPTVLSKAEGLINMSTYKFHKTVAQGYRHVVTGIAFSFQRNFLLWKYSLVWNTGQDQVFGSLRE
jgi:hypothetical protein